MERNIRKAIQRISPVSVRVEADLRPFEHSIDTLRNFEPARIPVVPDVDRDRFEVALETALAGLQVSVRVVPDLDDFDEIIRTHNAPTVTVEVRADTDRFGAALALLSRTAGRTGSALTGLLGFGAVGIAAAGAAQSIIGLTAALAPAAGAAAALPAVFLGAGIAMKTFELATQGVSKTLGALVEGDVEKFEKELARLSPAAREAVGELKGLRGAQQALQERFFQGLVEDLGAAVKNLSPLKAGLDGIVDGLGQVVSEALKFGASQETFTGLQSVMTATQSALNGLSDATQPVLKGFLAVAAAVSDAFGARLGVALGGVGKQFGAFLQNAADSGQAVAWVEGAVTALSQLGRILGNVGSVLNGVFEAGNAVVGGFLNTLEKITAGFAEFVKSTQGQEAIRNLFATIASIAAQLGPILAAIVTQIGAIAPALAPVFETLGPAIVSVINSLGPALAAIAPSLQTVAAALADALGQIADSGALTALGAALGQVLAAVSPLLPVIAQLAILIGTTLAPLISALASALGPLIAALAGALSPVISALSAAFGTLATSLAPVITLIGTTLGQVISALAPLLASLAGAVAQIVAAFAPLIEQLAAALLPVLQPIVDAFSAVLSALLPLVPAVADLVAALAPFVSLLISALAPIAQFAAEILKWITINAVVPVISAVVSALTTIITGVTAVLNGVRGFVTRAVTFFISLQTQTVSAVSGLVVSVATFFLTLHGRVIGAVARLVPAVISFFTSMASRAISVVSGFVTGVATFFLTLHGRVIGTAARLVSSVVSFLASLPGKARAALSGIGSTLLSAGRDLIQGMINGVKASAGALIDAAKSVVSGAVDGAKALLGISSPSKVFAEIGRFVGQGFIKGLTGTEADIRQAAEQLVSKIRDAFRGRNTRLDDRLIAQVQATTKRLTRLAADREALAEKIRKANELAAQTAQNALSAFSLQNLAGDGAGVQQLTDGIESAVSQIRKFNDQVNSLARRGLRKDLLSQIIGLGPEQGSALASSLARATSAQLEDLNEAQKQLAAASKKLGRDSADNLFDAGKEASKGFLAGLKEQQDDVEDLMLTLARSMARAIRAALGIRSPSRLFRGIGRDTMDGLSAGVKERVRDVRRSVLGAASALADPFGASGSLGSVNVTSGRQAGAGGRAAASARSQVNNITINEVGDGEATAQRILARLALAGGGL
jgi:phage-related protein